MRKPSAFSRLLNIFKSGITNCVEAAFALNPPEDIDARKAQEFASKALFYAALSSGRNNAWTCPVGDGRFLLIPADRVPQGEEVAMVLNDANKAYIASKTYWSRHRRYQMQCEGQLQLNFDSAEGFEAETEAWDAEAAVRNGVEYASGM